MVWHLKQIDCMEWCLARAAAAPDGEREALQQLAWSFYRSAVQIERSLSLIAESKALLAEVDRLLPPMAKQPTADTVGASPIRRLQQTPTSS